MKAAILALLLFAGQAITHLSQPVVHLRPNTNEITVTMGGSLLELIHSPTTILLPSRPPKPGGSGEPWRVDVRNLGPEPVTVIDHANFGVPVAVGQTVHIYFNGRVYLLKH